MGEQTAKGRLDEPNPCRLCGKRTWSDATRLCDMCWELDHRVRMDVDMTRRILAQVDDGEVWCRSCDTMHKEGLCR